MIIEKKINGIIFVEQRTYYIYRNEKERRMGKFSLVTSEKKTFIDHKRIARKIEKQKQL